MHSSGLAHGDVRLENCLVTNEGEIKLSDFEFCKPANLPCQVFEGSNYYMSPEIIRHVKYLPCKSDVFAAGCVLFSLIFGCPAFESASLEDRWYCTLVTRPEKFWNHLESRRKRVKYDLRCLLGNMLCYDPEDRMDFKEILSHPWLRTENL
jgi:serine/threonine protein kinase